MSATDLNPISLVILIPVFDQLIYPTLRKYNVNLTPIKKMTFGFFLASIAMMSATITQHYIYQTSPCGDRAGTCDEVSPLNVWIQSRHRFQ
jgi:POT family proton-dependent oligopeptide transporter